MIPNNGSTPVVPPFSCPSSTQSWSQQTGIASGVPSHDSPLTTSQQGVIPPAMNPGMTASIPHCYTIPNNTTNSMMQYYTPQSYSDPHRSNLVFQWNSGQQTGRPNFDSNFDPNGSESHLATNQIPSGGMTTTVTSRGPQMSSDNEITDYVNKRRNSARGPGTSSVHTSIHTRSTGQSPVAHWIQQPAEQGANSNLTGQLDQIHQAYRDGIMDSGEYHQRVADIMMQVHTLSHETIGPSFIQPQQVYAQYGGIPQTVPGSNVVVLPSNLFHSQMVGALPSNPLIVPGQSHPAMLTPVFGTSPTPTAVPSGLETTTTTTMTTRNRAPSIVHSSPASVDRNLSRSMTSRDHSAKDSSRNPVTAVALSPSDLLLMLKLLEQEQESVSNSQIVALAFSVIRDAGHALDRQLKADSDSKAVAPQIQKILASTKAASSAAVEFGSFANAIYKTLKRCKIRGLKSKHNRLRLLATEGATRKWRGSELLEFVVSLLKSIDSDLTASDRIAVLKALVEKLKRRAGATGSLGELYKAFDIVFPGADEEAELRLALYNSRSRVRSLTFSKDLCHICESSLVGLRFRCFSTRTDSLSKHSDESFRGVSAKARDTNTAEYILCCNCFLAAHSNVADNTVESGNDSFEGLSPQRSSLSSHKHKDYHFPSARQFICELPFSVLSPGSYRHYPLTHMTVAPTQGWNSKGSAVVMASKSPRKLRSVSSTSSTEGNSKGSSRPHDSFENTPPRDDQTSLPLCLPELVSMSPKVEASKSPENPSPLQIPPKMQWVPSLSSGSKDADDLSSVSSDANSVQATNDISSNNESTLPTNNQLAEDSIIIGGFGISSVSSEASSKHRNNNGAVTTDNVVYLGSIVPSSGSIVPSLGFIVPSLGSIVPSLGSIVPSSPNLPQQTAAKRISIDSVISALSTIGNEVTITSDTEDDGSVEIVPSTKLRYRSQENPTQSSPTGSAVTHASDMWKSTTENPIEEQPKPDNVEKHRQILDIGNIAMLASPRFEEQLTSRTDYHSVEKEPSLGYSLSLSDIGDVENETVEPAVERNETVEPTVTEPEDVEPAVEPEDVENPVKPIEALQNTSIINLPLGALISSKSVVSVDDTSETNSNYELPRTSTLAATCSKSFERGIAVEQNSTSFWARSVSSESFSKTSPYGRQVSATSVIQSAVIRMGSIGDLSQEIRSSETNRRMSTSLADRRNSGSRGSGSGSGSPSNRSVATSSPKSLTSSPSKTFATVPVRSVSATSFKTSAPKAPPTGPSRNQTTAQGKPTGGPSKSTASSAKGFSAPPSRVGTTTRRAK